MYYFIVNPSANRGHGEKVWRELERCLRNSEVEYGTSAAVFGN